MFKFLCSFLLVFSFTTQALAESTDGVYVFANPQDSEASSNGGVGLSEPFVEDYFSEASEFNYYGKDMLSTRFSIFLDGMAPRFVDINYNGFSLRDPSHPEGYFDIRSLVGLTGKKRISKSGNKILLSNEHSEKGFLEMSVSQLGEAEAGFQKNKCTESFCYSGGARLQRGGGFSQRENGVEDDYFHRINLNFNSTRYRASFEEKTFMFYSGGKFDEDGFISSPESLDGESTESVLFAGKRLKFKDLNIQGSYLRSYRKQEVGSVFNQKSQVFELGATYKKMGLKVYNERYSNFSSFTSVDDSDLDSGVELSFQNKKNVQSILVKGGYTIRRKLYGSAEWSYKSLGLFYKAVPASLYQTSQNNISSTSFEDLKTQNMIGARYEKGIFKNKFVNIGARASYTRTYEFIDYANPAGLPTTGGYFNLDEIETALLKLKVETKYFNAYAQRLLARDVSTKKDLVRRPDWTLGLNAFKQISAIKINADVKWVSSRTDGFGGNTYLKAFWETRVRLGYKDFELSARNVLNQDTVILAGFERRPLTFELKYRKTF